MRLVETGDGFANFMFGWCIDIQSEIDADNHFLTGFHIAPTANDRAGCDVDWEGTKLLLALTATSILSVLSAEHDPVANMNAIVELMKRLKSVTKDLQTASGNQGGRSVDAVMTMGGGRLEFSIGPAENK